MADQNPKNSGPFKTFFMYVCAVLTALSLIFGLGIIVYNLVDNRIKQAVNNEKFIRKVAANIRPYVIFDVDESILADGGAMQYLEQICVEIKGETWENAKPEEKHVYNLKIIVIPKSYLAHSPLIEPLSGLRDIVIYDGERGTGYQWTY